MKERNFYRLIIVVLIALNVGVIITTVMSRNQREDRPPFSQREIREGRQFLSDKLNLSQNQEKYLSDLRNEHFSQIRQLKQEILRDKINLYIHLGQDASQDSVDFLADQIAAKEKAIELATYQHFKHLRDTLEYEQRQEFDSLIIKIISRGMRHPGFEHRKRRGRPSN